PNFISSSSRRQPDTKEKQLPPPQPPFPIAPRRRRSPSLDATPPSPVAIVVVFGGSFPALAGERNGRPVRSPFSLLRSRLPLPCIDPCCPSTLCFQMTVY
ncbi:unnamed protein product, partial [Linum tenue]